MAGGLSFDIQTRNVGPCYCKSVLSLEVGVSLQWSLITGFIVLCCYDRYKGELILMFQMSVSMVPVTWTDNRWVLLFSPCLAHPTHNVYDSLPHVTFLYKL